MFNKLSKGYFFLVVLLILGACASKPAKIELAESIGDEESSPILFLADPQIHNIYGMGLKQMSRLSDIASKVAVRHPEINILAPLVLENLISQSEIKNRSEAIVVLGDAMNIGCSGEFSVFMESMNNGNTNELPIFLAHGNHDTYLMGTVNHYFPTDSALNWQPTLMARSPIPTDEDWWGEGVIESRNGRNWRDGCYAPEGESSPMNKSRWLAKYVLYLQSMGLRRENVVPTKEGKWDASSLSYVSEVDTALNKLDFEARGLWVPPEFEKDVLPTQSYFTNTYHCCPIN